MRIAVISDIHGNLEALTNVLVDIDKCHIDRIVNLGDNIGYGPDPEKVIQCIQKRQIPGIMGNHELAILEPDLRFQFNPNARKSLEITETMLSAKSREFIQRLKKSLVVYGCRFVHGFPPDSPTTYLFQADRTTLGLTFDASRESLCFTGHTHRPEIIMTTGDEIYRKKLGRKVFRIDPANKYIINVGSVGQPRDGDKSAKYIIWDAREQTIEMRYVVYDIATTIQKIIVRGLPRQHADRLWCSK
jgi:predicted phosphodiesterase